MKKNIRAYLAGLLAAVLTVGTAAAAGAAGGEPLPKARVCFNFGNPGIQLMNAGDEKTDPARTDLEGYQLLDVTRVLRVDCGHEEAGPHTDECYAYRYTIREDATALNEILRSAVNGVLTAREPAGTEVAAGEERDIPDRLATLKGDEPAAFAEAVWAGIQAYNRAAEEAARIRPGVAVTVKNQGGTPVDITDPLEIPNGYWLFVDASDYGDAAGTAFSPLLLGTLRNGSYSTDDIIVNVKKEVPELEKEVQDDNGGWSDTNTASFGEDVDFRLTTKVPAMEGYEKYFFVVTDTLSKGLDFKEGSVKITLGNDTLQACTDVENHLGENKSHENAGCDYYVTAEKSDTTGETTVTIVFIDFVQYKASKGTNIAITYAATVNKDAATGVAPNTNKAQLTYSNDPREDADGVPGRPDEPRPDSPTGRTPEDSTATYVTALRIVKVNAEGERLTGAEFQLTGNGVKIVVTTTETFTEDENGTYWKLKDGSYTTTAPTTGDGGNENDYADTEKKYKMELVTETKGEGQTAADVKAEVGEDGVVTFTGLGAGSYTIEETKVPEKYNKIDNIDLTIKFGMANGAAKWTFDSTELGIADGATDADGVIELTVINHSGLELPSTGGMGTTVLYAAGGLLVLMAGAVLLHRRREGTE